MSSVGVVITRPYVCRHGWSVVYFWVRAGGNVPSLVDEERYDGTRWTDHALPCPPVRWRRWRVEKITRRQRGVMYERQLFVQPANIQPRYRPTSESSVSWPRPILLSTVRLPSSFRHRRCANLEIYQSTAAHRRCVYVKDLLLIIGKIG